MNNNSPRDWYKRNIQDLTLQLQSLSKKRTILGWSRLLLLVSALIFLWLLWSTGIGIAISVFLLFIAGFLALVATDLKNNQSIQNTATLILINEKEIKTLDHDFLDQPDGAAMEPSGHDYANDLDVFGHASLYQYCNRSNSEQGQQLFANWLLKPASTKEVRQRQLSVAELAQKSAWRQQLQAIGDHDKIRQATEDKIRKWLSQETRFITKRYWKVLRILLPLAGSASLILYIAGLLGAQWFYAIMFIFFIASLLISKKVMPEYRQLNKIAAEIETLSDSIKHIEKESFQTERLSFLKTYFEPGKNRASQIVAQYKSILDRLDYRLNPLVFIPLNTILFWDLLQVMTLEKWKTENRDRVANWFNALAEIEALSSLANLSFNNPGWCFPELAGEESQFESRQLGHPLIPENKRITSSFSTIGKGQVNLITGSNMAGKSTFLRSVGINIILAMAGGPACASRMRLSPMKVMSSMRVSDNLEESTSTFYAELKKLKKIIEAVNQREKIILLLDEILRGTNSADRHTGSTALIKQLIHHDAVALVATHDLELTGLANEFPVQLHNFHFDVQVANDELFFDYKLKTGICKSMNASLLMKKIGIEMG